MRNASSASDVMAETERAQARASDPTASAWVAANAGAGKTHVLKMRVLRLLLAGTAPERILCLTYTKAAAAEMSQRVFGELGQWAIASDDALGSSLMKLTGARPGADDLARARTLFARAIETPGGLKVQTIHAFCERLLQRFPLEAGVPPGFSILDDAQANQLFRDAVTGMLDTATREPASALGQALRLAVVHVQGDAFEGLVRNAVLQRDWLQGLEDIEQLTDDDDDEPEATAPPPGRDFRRVRRLYCRSADLDPTASVAGHETQIAGLVDPTTLGRAIRVLQASKSTRDNQDGEKLARVLRAESDAGKAAALVAALLTQKREPRSDKSLITVAVRAAEPALVDRLTRARDEASDLLVETDALRMIEATIALATLASDVRQRYTEEKNRGALLDFDDLIGRTAGLLSTSAAADWVLYKLDGGLDHVLVDEAQDTSPRQWAVIEALVAEFFAGRTAHDARAATPAPGALAPPARTAFAVGDGKQSIYSFQGAAPERFAEVGQRLRTSAKSAERTWHDVPLTLSFRTVPPVLQAVDRIFADAARTPGLTAGQGDDGPAVRHQPKRTGSGGLVEVWPTEQHAETVPGEAFAPDTARREPSPAERLATRIAETIAHWLKSGEQLVSAGRPIRAGDIIILVARRRPFANVMIAALEARGIRVAGADRMQLHDQLAAADLLALGQVLVLPEDDLSLAAVLKSPLFDLNDDDLIRLAPGRPGSLYSALMKQAKDPRLGPVVERLKRWRAVADRRPPFEFYARLLDEDGMRDRLVARLGPEARDAIDELLAAALAFDDTAPASLQGFLTHMADARVEVKRDMEPARDQVRILTVHGAKGLEAPIVFLPDTCGKAIGVPPTLYPLTDEHVQGAWPVGDWPKLAWSVKGSKLVPALQTAKLAHGQAAERERNRLLYVALTRARDRLYVAGFEGRSGRDPASWYETVLAGLGDRLTSARDWAGRDVSRITHPQTDPPEPHGSAAHAQPAIIPRPAWAVTRARRETGPVIPLAPSRLAPLETDGEGEPAERPAARVEPRDAAMPTPGMLGADHRFERGLLTHALLEHLPTLAPDRWRDAATAFLDVRGRDLRPALKRSIAEETLRLLQHLEFAPVFGPGSVAEVPIAADLPVPGRAGGTTLRVVGSIDRLVETDHGVLIVDFKTNRPPPTRVEDVAPAYLLQLAAYRLVLKQIFAPRQVQAALLWTDGARLMPIPEATLDACEPRLWEMAAAGSSA